MTMDLDDLITPETGVPLMTLANSRMDTDTILSWRPGFHRKIQKKRKNGLTLLHLFVFFMQIVANETKKKKLRAQRWWTNTNG